MISAICGNLAHILEDRIILELNGLFYEILVSPVTLNELYPKLNQEITLRTIFYIQGTVGMGNMIPMLIGFITDMEKEFFEHFITVGGIGPRGALRALIMPIERIACAIENKDISILTTLPGIGKQRANKIIAELKGKMDKFAIKVSEEKDIQDLKDRHGDSDIKEEAIDVLMQLGYRRQESEDMVIRALSKNKNITSAEVIIQEIFKSGAKPKGSKS